MSLRDATQLVREHATASTPNLWPSRPERKGSALGRDTAARVFEDTALDFGRWLAGQHPRPLMVPPRGADASDARYVNDFVEQHSGYFARRRRARLAKPTAGDGFDRPPYDQMAAAYPRIARVVAPVLLGQALSADPSLALDALEPVVLLRKPSERSRLPNFHTGRDSCGGTLNALALVAHLRVDGERRCVATGARPLPAATPIEWSIPRALLSLLTDADLAAHLLAGTRGAEQLASAAVVSGLLAAGGPRGKGPRNCTDAELVAGRTADMLVAVRKLLAPVTHSAWRPRPFALAIPTATAKAPGPRRIAPSSLEPRDPGWPVDPERFAAAVASAETIAPADAPRPAAPSRWAQDVAARDCPSVGWQAPAQIAGPRGPVGVALLAHQDREGGRATIWVADRNQCAEALVAIDAVLDAREPGLTSPQLTSSPFEQWIMRAFRRYAAADLIVKGSASDALRAGVGGTMAAGFLGYVLGVDELLGDAAAAVGAQHGVAGRR